MPSRTLAGVLSAALVGGALAGIGSRSSPETMRPASRPNVLLIVIDTLRADHVGPYGYALPTSPHLDRLARQGARFATVRAPSAWTGASVASLLTGLAPAVHGVEYHDSVLARAHETMPEAFHDAGYETVAFSANAAFVTPEAGVAQGFDRFDVMHGDSVERGKARDAHWADVSFQTLVEVATADQVTDAVLTWLRNRTSTDRPFFTYVHYFDPHAGYFPPPAFAARFGVPPDAPMLRAGQRRFIFHRMRNLGDTDPAAVSTLTALYDAEIAFTDAHVGRLLLGLAASRSGPTLIVVTSDHGEEFGEHGGLQHSRTLFDEILRVPLIMAGAGIPPGTTIETPLSLLDVWPLVADVTGVGRARHLPRRSLRTLAENHDTGIRQPFFADLEVNWAIHRRAMITGSSKLIVDRNRETHLYDLDDDPAELRDRSGDAPDETTTLRAALRMRDARTRTAPARTAPGRRILTAERRARLEALGYVE